MKTDNALPHIGSFQATSLDDPALHTVRIYAMPGAGLVQIGPYMVTADRIEELATNLLFARSLALQSFLQPPAEFAHADLAALHAKLSELGDDGIGLACELRGLAEGLEAQSARVETQYRKLRATIRRVQDEQQEQRLFLSRIASRVVRLAALPADERPTVPMMGRGQP